MGRRVLTEPFRALLQRIVVFYYQIMLEQRAVGRLINRVIRLVFVLLDHAVSLVTRLGAVLSKKELLPPISSELVHLSASQLAQRIRNREVRCVDVVETYINRIKDINPIINSVVEERFEDGLREAQTIDNMLAESEAKDSWEWLKDKPLLGVPFSVKETIAVKGMSNNAARSRVQSRRAEEDAKIVRQLRDAGAIPLVVTNTPELCLYWETWNPKVGRTRNPYDTRRSVGGSSGGEVSLISGGGSVVGLGSDIAGSLRFPAHFSGVFGHKPTPGFVSNEGHMPTSTDEMWDFYFTLGPISRYAEDLPLILRTISSPDKVAKLQLDQQVDVSKVKIYYMLGEGSESILQRVPGPEAVRAIGAAVTTLKEKYNCHVEEVKIKEFVDSLYLNSLMLQMKAIENVFQPDDEHPDDWGLMDVIKALFKKVTFRSSASISCILFGPLKYLVDLTPEYVRQLLREKVKHIQNKVEDLLGDDAVLLYPTFPEEAPLHNRMCSKILDVSYCTIFNVLGLPVTQCPVTLTKEGLPVGLQIVGGRESDRLCMAVARAIEKALGGWQAPPSKP